MSGLMQDRHNSIANALELHISCTNLAICIPTWPIDVHYFPSLPCEGWGRCILSLSDPLIHHIQNGHMQQWKKWNFTGQKDWYWCHGRGWSGKLSEIIKCFGMLDQTFWCWHHFLIVLLMTAKLKYLTGDSPYLWPQYIFHGKPYNIIYVLCFATKMPANRMYPSPQTIR